MSIVTKCTALGCKTLTIGPLCIEHELPLTRNYLRGRPSPQAAESLPRLPLYSVAVGSHAREVKRASAQPVGARGLR